MRIVSHRTGKTKLTDAVAWAKKDDPGRKSDFIDPCRIRRGDRIVLACRVSQGDQELKGNLDDQESNLREIVEKHGGIVVDAVKHLGKGWDTYWLRKVVRLARKHNAKVLAETSARLIRHRIYHPNDNPDKEPTWNDLERMKSALQDVEVMTFVHPDATLAEIKGFETKRGQEQKGNKGGRPRKAAPGSIKERRLKLRPTARRLRREGFSLGKIAAQLDVPKPTIQGWLT